MNNPRRIAILLVILMLVTVPPTFGKNGKTNHEEQIREGLFSIKSAELFDHVRELCRPEYRGRLTGDIGYDRAADWLIRQFRKLEISPFDSGGSYLQTFPHPYTWVEKDCYLRLHLPVNGEEIVKSYHYFDEFIPGSTSGSGTVTAEAVYVGYGITAPELGYDDYAGVEVKGKIVVMEREVPVSPDPERKKEFLKWRPYSFHQYKLKNAHDHGAVGMLYNYGPIGNPNNAYIENFIYTHVGEQVMADLFAGTGKDPQKVRETIQETLSPQSLPTGKTITIRNTTVHHPGGMGANVIGVIPGADPRLQDETIILGGHLDHLGHCYELIPGANDNASAVAVMLGVARGFQASGIRPPRTLLFLAFGAEEAAIRGAQHFLNHPPVSLKKVVGLINMDGVGIGREIHAAFGKNNPLLFSYFERANRSYVHRKFEAHYTHNLGRPRLDAAFFDWADIPVLSFFARGGGPDYPIYHTPHDHPGHITPEIMEDLARVIFAGIIELAFDPHKPARFRGR